MSIAGLASNSASVSLPDLGRSLGAMATDRTRPTERKSPGFVGGRCDTAQLAEAMDGSGHLALFDGRLHDRDNSVAALDAPRGASDATLVLLAYEKWGARFAGRLTGEFACAVWDTRARRLVLSRDAIGTVPLCYFHAAGSLHFASEPRGLFVHPDIPRALDPTWLARWLSLLPEDPQGTEYLGISRVPPGHFVCFDGDRLTVERHWRPEDLPPLKLPGDAAYEQRLRDVLGQAVKDRLAPSRSVGTYLSGGLDSSAVATVAAAALEPQRRRMTAFTAVPTNEFDLADPRRFGDEGPFAAAVAAGHDNIDHVLVPNFERPLFDVMDRAAAAAEGPPLNPRSHVWFDEIGRLARERGIDTLLMGAYGNYSISYDGLSHLRDLLRRGRWVELVREARALRRAGVASWPGLADISAGWLLPPWVRTRLLAVRGRVETRLSDFSAIDPEFARRTGIDAEAEAMAGDVRNSREGRFDYRLAAIRRIDVARTWRAFRRQFGITLTDPTGDRRVIEFCLAIPHGQYLRNGQTRSLVRRAFRGHVPDVVLDERRRGLLGADWHVAANAARGEMAAEVARLERSPLASKALDLKRLRRLVDDWPAGGWNTKKVVYDQLALTRGLSAGRFIRRFEGGNE